MKTKTPKSNNALRTIILTAMLAALYFVFSTTLKIPFVGNISLDLGYIVLTVAAVCLGWWQAACVGAIGCAIESLTLSAYGFSPSWFVMNIIVGCICGLVLPRLKTKKTIWIGFVTIVVAVFLGIVAKTIIECNLYSIPLIVKIPKALTAWAIDSITMCAAYPMAIAIKRRVLKE